MPYFYETRLSNVYPTEISPSTLSWEGGELMTLSVNFSYDRMVFSGNRPYLERGTPRGISFIDYYKTIDGSGYSDISTQEKTFKPFSRIPR